MINGNESNEKKMQFQMKRRKHSANFFSHVFGLPLYVRAFVNVYLDLFGLFVIGRCLLQNPVVRLKRISFEMNTNESRTARTRIEFSLDIQNQKQRKKNRIYASFLSFS